MLLLSFLAAATVQADPASPRAATADVPREVRQALICSRGVIIQTPTADPAIRKPGVLKLGDLPDAHRIRTVLRNHCNAEDVKFNVSTRPEPKTSSPVRGKDR